MKKYKFTFYCTILILGVLKSQVNTFSPYSYFGVGELSNSFNPAAVSMGGLNSVFNKNNSVNFINPSTYSLLNQTAFEVGNKTTFSKISNQNVDQNNFNISLSHLSLGFPISKKIGFALALLPYSSVGYNVSSLNQNSELGAVLHNYNGEGGLNKFVVGSGWSITDNISIGLNWNWLFGTISKNTSVSTGNSPIYFGDEIVFSMGDFSYDLGLIVKQKINNYQLSLGAIISPEKKMSSKISRMQYTYSYSGDFVNVIDTILSENNNSDSEISLPLNYSIGFSVDNLSSWLVGVEYTYTNWSIVDYLIWESSLYSLVDLSKLSMGVHFTPKKDDIYNYFNTIEYRLGITYSSGYLDLAHLSNSTIESTNLDQIAFNVGMGLPIKKASSMLHVGLKYNVSLNNDNLETIKHSFVSLNIAMTLNEKWFKKIKID